jgi:hypothetical protein
MVFMFRFSNLILDGALREVAALGLFFVEF